MQRAREIGVPEGSVSLKPTLRRLANATQLNTVKIEIQFASKAAYQAISSVSLVDWVTFSDENSISHIHFLK